MEFTPLERAILDWIAKHSGNEVIAEQLSAVVPTKRELTGVGSFTTLQVAEAAPRLEKEIGPAGPFIESPELEYGAGSLLWFEHGLPCLLEIYSHSDTFHSDIGTWTLAAIGSES